MEWLDAKNFSFISEIDTPTHNRGNVLDLCFSSNSLLAKGCTASVQQDLDVTSDHLPILALVPLEFPIRYTEPKLRIASLNEEVFKTLLTLNIAHIATVGDKSPSIFLRWVSEKVLTSQ
ncbi:hypothetical protein EV44_g4310 [Erysiphe necator]|uniref:Uncharacterized protein n=1 Tax=Uncinula necator TaxID=52586 RepID=A0A0B1P2C6_UNCNE|nr:hypothetical protein EV44_g4310 [Erysiphe necator]